MRGRVARNLLKAWLLVVGLAACFAALGWLIGGPTPASVFAACSVLAASAVYWAGDRVVLGALGARPLALAEAPLLHASVERLSVEAGVRPPRLQLLPDGYPRAFAVGRGPTSSSLAVSTGLLGALPPDELDAVVAHELSHVRSRDILTQTFAVVLASALLDLTRIGGWFSRALLAVFAPLAAAFTHALLSPSRELHADADAARLTNGEDVATALLRLDRASELVAFAASPATEPLYTVSPFDHSERVPAMFSTHPPLEQRISALRGSLHD